MKWPSQRSLIVFLIIFSFTLLLISITQCFHLFLKSFMIKINRLDIFNTITLCVYKRTYAWSNYLIFCFYCLIKDFISNWKCSENPWKEPHKTLYYKKFMKTKNKFWFDRYKRYRNILNCLITKSKKKTFERFLPKTSSKLCELI